MDGEAGWWTTCGNIGLPPLARVMGVGRQQQHPISFYSKKLNKHQRNYSTIEKECFSLVSALHHYDVHVNVTRHPVLVYTDHNPLVFIGRMKLKYKKIFEVELIQSCNLEIKHIKGKNNVIADALSRVG